MITHTPTKTYTQPVYIISRTDKVESGVNGIDSKGNVNNAQSIAYVKQQNCEFIIGTGEPSGNYGVVADSDSLNNTFYLDQVTQSFWMPSTVTGQTIVTWTNISKNFQINSAGLRINDAGNDSRYAELKFDQIFATGKCGMILYDRNSDLSNLRVGKIIYEDMESLISNQLRVEDSELLSNGLIQTEAQNADGGFVVNHYSTSNSLEQKFFFFDVSKNTWSTYDVNGQVAINIGGVWLYGINLSNAASQEEYTVATQAEFDAIFNTAPQNGTTTFDPTFQYNQVYIADGEYTLNNYLLIQKEGLCIHSSPNAKVTIGVTGVNRALINYAWANLEWASSEFSTQWDVTPEAFNGAFMGFTGESTLITIDSVDKVELRLRLDCNHQFFKNIVNFTGTKKCRIDLEMFNVNGGTMIKSDGVKSDSTITFNIVHTTYHPEAIISNANGFYARGNYPYAFPIAFDNCGKYIVNGYVDNCPVITAG